MFPFNDKSNFKIYGLCTPPNEKLSLLSWDTIVWPIFLTKRYFDKTGRHTSLDEIQEKCKYLPVNMLCMFVGKPEARMCLFYCPILVWTITFYRRWCHLTSKSTLKNACLSILTTIFCSELAAIWSWVQLRRSTPAVFVGVVRAARAPTPRPQTSHSHGGRSHSLNAPHPVEGVRYVWPPLTEIFTLIIADFLGSKSMSP